MTNTKIPTPFEDIKGFTALEVKLRNDSDTTIFSKFKNAVQKDGILLEYKEKSRFEKKSDRIRREGREAQHRADMERNKLELMAAGKWDSMQQKKQEKKDAKRGKKVQ